jgi:hypothetical protein
MIVNLRAAIWSPLHKPCIPLRIGNCFLSSAFGFFNFFGLWFFTSSNNREVDKGGGVDLVLDGLFGARALAEPVRRGTCEGKRSALG